MRYMDEIKLSLKEEIKKQAQIIEEEILHNKENENLEVTNRMESALLRKIKQLESEKDTAGSSKKAEIHTSLQEDA